MAGRTKAERAEAEIGLHLLRVPWDSAGRDYVLERMERLAMSQDDLFYEMRVQGWTGSSSTLKRWLRDTPYKPDGDELWMLVVVLAGYSGNWPKASNLSSPQEAYSFWFTPLPEFDLGVTTAA